MSLILAETPSWQRVQAELTTCSRQDSECRAGPRQARRSPTLVARRGESSAGPAGASPSIPRCDVSCPDTSRASVFLCGIGVRRTGAGNARDSHRESAITLHPALRVGASSAAGRSARRTLPRQRTRGGTFHCSPSERRQGRDRRTSEDEHRPLDRRDVRQPSERRPVEAAPAAHRDDQPDRDNGRAHVVARLVQDRHARRAEAIATAPRPTTPSPTGCERRGRPSP